MKIKSLASICKKEKVICMHDGPGVQWVGTMHAIYPLHQLPILGEDELCAIFDFTEKDREKISILHGDMPSDIELEDGCDSETRLDYYEIGFDMGDKSVLLLKTPTGIAFMDRKYLAPVRDLPNIELYERRSVNGQPYIIIKSGLCVYGAVQPMKLLNDGFIKEITEIVDMCKIAWDNMQSENAGAESIEQITMEDKELLGRIVDGTFV